MYFSSPTNLYIRTIQIHLQRKLAGNHKAVPPINKELQRNHTGLMSEIGNQYILGMIPGSVAPQLRIVKAYNVLFHDRDNWRRRDNNE